MNSYASKAHFTTLCEKHRFFTDNSLVLMSPILHKMQVLNFMGKRTTGYKYINQNTSLKLFFNQMVQRFGSSRQQQTGRRMRRSQPRAPSTVCPMPGGCWSPQVPTQGSSLPNTPGFCVTGKMSQSGFFIGFELMYSVLCI